MKEEWHVLLLKSFKCCSCMIVPELIHPILPFLFVLFPLHLMAIRKHNFSVLVYKDKVMYWECAIPGMGSSRTMSQNFLVSLQCTCKYLSGKGAEIPCMPVMLASKCPCKLRHTWNTHLKFVTQSLGQDLTSVFFSIQHGVVFPALANWNTF